MGLFDELGKFFMGTPEKYEQRSNLGKEQQPLYKQMLAASQGKGAGGAFGESADYYRDLLSNDSQTANAMFAPEMRRFNEQIIPDLSEQFAGMGSGGGLSSSGFRNAAVNAGTDLSERLGAIRAQLRQQGAQGLSNLGSQGLQNFNEYYQSDPGSQGFLSQAAPLIGTAVGAFAGPMGASMGAQMGSSMFGKSDPYGDLNKMSNSVQTASNYNPLGRGR